MQGQQITVAEIISPAANKKQYTVIDLAGQRYGVFPDKIGEFTVGGIYRLDQVGSSNFMGKTYYTIKEASYIGMSGNGGSQAGQQQGRLIPASVKNSYQAPFPIPAPSIAPQQQSGSTEDARRQDIFVCGALNNILSNPNVNPLEMKVQDYIRIVGDLRIAWRNTMSGTVSRGDMNDELPEGMR